MKPQNLLVNANCDLALCDFGLSRGVSLESAENHSLTGYVVTRWYRAPELLCDSSSYGKQVDVWSVGCIFAEMMNRKTFFPGTSPNNQLALIVDVLGCPPLETLDFLTIPSAQANFLLPYSRQQSASLKELKPRPLSSCLPQNTNPLAIDLLSKMIVFNPQDRISVEEALSHPYLKELHAQMEEPSCREGHFNFDFERRGEGDSGYEGTLGKEDLQDMMFQEMLQLRSLTGSESVENSLESMNMSIEGDEKSSESYKSEGKGEKN